MNIKKYKQRKQFDFSSSKKFIKYFTDHFKLQKIPKTEMDKVSATSLNRQ